MIDLAHDIHSLTDFKRKTIQFMKQLKTQRRPIVLTVNGRAAVVIQDPDSYQKLLAQAHPPSSRRS